MPPETFPGVIRLLIVLTSFSLSLFSMWYFIGMFWGLLLMMCFQWANLSMQPPGGLTREIPRRQVIGILVMMAVLIVAMFAVFGGRQPPVQDAHPIPRLADVPWSPAVLVPFWALGCWMTVRNWRKLRRASLAAANAGSKEGPDARHAAAPLRAIVGTAEAPGGLM